MSLQDTVWPVGVNVLEMNESKLAGKKQMDGFSHQGEKIWIVLVRRIMHNSPNFPHANIPAHIDNNTEEVSEKLTCTISGLLLAHTDNTFSNLLQVSNNFS